MFPSYWIQVVHSAPLTLPSPPRIPQKCCVFQCVISEGNDLDTLLLGILLLGILLLVMLTHQDKVVSLSFLHCELLLLIINTYLVAIENFKV